MAFIKHSIVEENTGGTWLSYCMGLGGLPAPICVLSVPKAFILDIHLFQWPINHSPLPIDCS